VSMLQKSVLMIIIKIQGRLLRIGSSSFRNSRLKRGSKSLI